MGRVKTFTNGGSLLPGDLNSIQDDYEFAFSTYSKLGGGQGFSASGVAGTYIIAGTDLTSFNIAALGSVGTGTYAFYLDPADLTANTRTTKYRLRCALVTNAVAPAITYTIGLYPVASFGGAASAQPTIASLGAVVAGSTVAFATPGATSSGQANSGDFTAPAAGFFAFGVVLSGTEATTSSQYLKVQLQRRQV